MQLGSCSGLEAVVVHDGVIYWWFDLLHSLHVILNVVADSCQLL